jgi:hypothetical protein
MYKKLALFMTVAMVLLCSVPSFVYGSASEGSAQVEMIDGFEDVPVDYWAASSINTLAEKGIVESGEGVYFQSENPISRAEFLKLVMTAYYEDELVSGTACFSDVSASAWYSSYICTAKNLGIVTGYSGSTFKPNGNITRAEATAILVKALHVPAADDGLITFNDVRAEWQRLVVAAALGKSLINGYSTYSFGPNDLMLRSQGAKILCNALESLAEPLEGDVIVTETQQVEDEEQDLGEPVAHSDAIIVNHLNADLSKIPSSYISSAKAKYKIAYGHTSHGSQITTGIDVIDGISDLYKFNSSGSDGALYYNEGLLSGDLGGDWSTQTRTLLSRSGNDINLVMWSWCGQMSSLSSSDVTDYLNKMNQLEIDYPNVTFVYMTGHLDGTGESGVLHKNNEQIRKFVRDNNKILFDFADIESYDPAGNYYLNKAANDNNDYTGGNWSQEWCAANSSSSLCAVNSCAHSQALNCNLKGRAFWWLIARLGGWEG